MGSFAATRECLVRIRRKPTVAALGRCGSDLAPAVRMPNPAATLATHCPYCALQCGMHVARGSGRRRRSSATRDSRSTREASASKAGRRRPRSIIPIGCRTPLVRDGTGRLVPATWDEALSRIARRIHEGSAELRTRRRRRVRRRLADQRESLPAGQVRARRAAAHRTSTTTAASACRPQPRLRHGRSASIAACRFRWPIFRRPTRSCWSAATSPRRCRRSCGTSRRSKRTAAS